MKIVVDWVDESPSRLALVLLHTAVIAALIAMAIRL
jgi:hypothetical protein